MLVGSAYSYYRTRGAGLSSDESGVFPTGKVRFYQEALLA